MCSKTRWPCSKPDSLTPSQTIGIPSWKSHSNSSFPNGKCSTTKTESWNRLLATVRGTLLKMMYLLLSGQHNIFFAHSKYPGNIWGLYFFLQINIIRSPYNSKWHLPEWRSPSGRNCIWISVRSLMVLVIFEPSGPARYSGSVNIYPSPTFSLTVCHPSKKEGPGPHGFKETFPFISLPF